MQNVWYSLLIAANIGELSIKMLKANELACVKDRQHFENKIMWKEATY